MPTVSGNTNINGAFIDSGLTVTATIIKDGTVSVSGIVCSEVSGTGVYTATMPTGLTASRYQVVFISGALRAYSEISWDGDDEDGDFTPVNAENIRAIPVSTLLTNDARLNYLDANISGIINLTAAEVWNNSTRELTTGTDLTPVINAISGLNNITVDEIWVAATRSLTDKADFTLSNASADDVVYKVWNYTQ